MVKYYSRIIYRKKGRGGVDESRPQFDNVVNQTHGKFHVTADGLDIRSMSPVLGIAIGTILGVILLILLIFLNMWRSRSLFAARRTIDDSPERKHDQITVAPIANHCDDMNPDIIPAKYGKRRKF